MAYTRTSTKESEPHVITRLTTDFYRQDVLALAPGLVGKILCRRLGAEVKRARITETEAYRGENDSACHARAGRTTRTHTLYEAGGIAYVYLCYGIHHLLNVVSGAEGEPQAALIRALSGYPGPGRLTKAFGISRSENRLDLAVSGELWIEDDGFTAPQIATGGRIGISYATAEDQALPWRYWLDEEIVKEPATDT